MLFFLPKSLVWESFSHFCRFQNSTAPAWQAWQPLSMLTVISHQMEPLHCQKVIIIIIIIFISSVLVQLIVISLFLSLPLLTSYKIVFGFNWLLAIIRFSIMKLLEIIRHEALLCQNFECLLKWHLIFRSWS